MEKNNYLCTQIAEFMNRIILLITTLVLDWG